MADEHLTGAPCCGACGFAQRVASGEIEAPPSGSPMWVKLGADGAPIGVAAIVNGASIPLTRGHVRFGRSTNPDHVDVPIRGDNKLSRLQFTLDFTPDGVFIADHFSACGTLVNGHPIAQAVFPEGGEILVGDSVVRLVRVEGSGGA